MTIPFDPVAQRTALSFRTGIHNQVLFVLVAIGAVAVALSGFVGFAPNRLVSGNPIPLWKAAGALPAASIALLGTLILAASLAKPSKPVLYSAAVSAALLLLVALTAAGQAARTLSLSATPASRISLAPAFWILVACAALAVGDALQRLEARIATTAVAVIAITSGAALLAALGTFDALSIAREYESRHQEFSDALVRHMTLVGASVGGAVAIGFPLGVATAKRPRLEGPVFAILNTLQTIPSIALFGLLIVPLSALAAAMPWLGAFGIAGVGMAPAIIALVLYALLPAVRNTVAGLRSVDNSAIDAADPECTEPRHSRRQNRQRHDQQAEERNRRDCLQDIQDRKHRAFKSRAFRRGHSEREADRHGASDRRPDQRHMPHKGVGELLMAALVLARDRQRVECAECREQDHAGRYCNRCNRPCCDSSLQALQRVSDCERSASN